MRHPTWSVEVNMKLGTETAKFARKVSLGDDVRTVLRNMADTRNAAVSVINEAYEAILVSASKDMAARTVKRAEKNGGK
jgi:hypothetical protein